MKLAYELKLDVLFNTASYLETRRNDDKVLYAYD